MAWGGMKYDHGLAAWACRDRWLGIVKDLRAGTLSRQEAYARFRQFRAGNSGSGMGPAYYTKLIFFARPRADNDSCGTVGYIMDQWTSLSINLLFDTGNGPLIDLSSTEYNCDGTRTRKCMKG